MNIVEVVLKEHSKAMKDRVIRYVGHNPARFKELVEVFLNGPYRVTQRSGWPLTFCVEHHPALIKPHLKRILNQLKISHDISTKRNIIRLFQFIDFPPALDGQLTKICFNFLTDSDESIAVRVFSMTVLGRIAKRRPEIGRELKIIIEDLMPYGSSGFNSRARKVLKDLKV
jgi:hypothetical protein